MVAYTTALSTPSPPEQQAVTVGAGVRRRAGAEKAVIGAGHGDPGDQQQHGQRGEGGGRDLNLAAVQPPHQGVHDASPIAVSVPFAGLAASPM
jgi:hypothetical protein